MGRAPRLSDAAFVGDLARVRELLAAGADVNEEISGTYALFAALQEPPDYFDDNAAAIVRALLAAGARVDVREAETGRTPLHEAVHPGLRAVKLLLDAGADPNAVSKTGTTPLHETIPLAAVAVAEELLRAGADLSLRDSEGRTPLDLAASKARAYPDDEQAASLVRLLSGRTAP